MHIRIIRPTQRCTINPKFVRIKIFSGQCIVIIGTWLSREHLCRYTALIKDILNGLRRAARTENKRTR